MRSIRSMRYASMVLVLFAAPATAGEFYMISRQADGTFSASHRVFEKAGENLYRITLCGREYYARAATVGWLNYEASEGRDVGLEYNEGQGWFRVCEEPDKQVSLKDIGVPGTNADVMRSSDGAVSRRQRFKDISKAFSDYKNSGEKTKSYHLW